MVAGCAGVCAGRRGSKSPLSASSAGAFCCAAGPHAITSAFGTLREHASARKHETWLLGCIAQGGGGPDVYALYSAINASGFRELAEVKPRSMPPGAKAPLRPRT